MNKQYIIITSDCGRGCEYDCDCPPDTQIVNSISELVKLIANDISYDYSAMNELIQCQDIKKQLDQLGFRKVDELKDISDKIIAEQRYFKYGDRVFSSPDEIDFSDIDNLTIEEIAKDSVLLLQSISKESLKTINPKIYKKLKDCQKQIKEKEKISKERAKARQQKKKMKKLEAAKKLLQEAGEIE